MMVYCKDCRFYRMRSYIPKGDHVTDYEYFCACLMTAKVKIKYNPIHGEYLRCDNFMYQKQWSESGEWPNKYMNCMYYETPALEPRKRRRFLMWRWWKHDRANDEKYADFTHWGTEIYDIAERDRIINLRQKHERRANESAS